MPAPRHAAKRPTFTTYGTFVQMATGQVILRAKNGDHWTSDYVSIQTGAFGFTEEGFERLPRPSTYDGDGKVVIQGDLVRIDFLNGNPKLPIVTGGFRAAKRLDTFFVLNHASAGADPNRIRMRARTLADDGTVNGEIRFQALEDETGSAALKATTKIELFVGDDLDTTDGVTITIDGTTITLDNGSVRLKVDGAVVTTSTSDTAVTSTVVMADTFLADLAIALGDVATGFLAVPYTATGVTDFITSLGTAYKSTTLKAE